MKGDNKMTFSPGYAEFIGKELQRDRMREAERERLINQATAWNPPLPKKLSVILRSRWHDFWTSLKKDKYPPISQVPKSSPSL
jgi:hypothetical protein